MGATSDKDIIKDEKGNIISIKIDKNHGKNKPNIGKSKADFENIKNLGKGNYGSVNLVKSKITQSCYAMKKIEIKNNNRKSLLREIKLLESLNHPHVINYFTSFEENEFFYIVVEYMNGPNLQDLIKENENENKYMEEKKIWELLIQTLSGLLYLHNTMKIVHRDVKPDNLLLDRAFNLKISDFGISAIDDITVEEILQFNNTKIGPVKFMAPEVANLKKDDTDIRYDFKSDIYMLGLTFFLLASKNHYLIRKSKGQEVFTEQTNAKIPNIYSDDLKKFIYNLLQIEIQKRPPAKQAFLDALYIYTFKYLKVTSIMSLFFCFFSMASIIDYFKDDELSDKIENDQINKYTFTKYCIEALNYCNPYYFSYEEMKQICLLLRYLFDKEKNDINKSPEICLTDFIKFILSHLTEELTEENENVNQNQQMLREVVDETNETSVLEKTLNNWQKNNSIIKDELFYLTETIYECLECKNFIKYKIDLDCLCLLYPGKTSHYLKKKDININDLFIHFRKKRKYGNENIYCKYCNKNQYKVFKTNILYTCPPNLILRLEYEKNTFNFIIEEIIDIKDFVKINSNCLTKYKLMGAIFSEYNANGEKIYTSISKDMNNQWVYFNGKKILDSNLNDIQNHNNIEFLFYSVLDENEI